MKALIGCGILLLALVTGPASRAQSSNAAPAASVSADAAKTETTNQTVKATEPYPVTAIVVSNVITFPILLSAKSEPLMTNAVYRRTFGRKVIFAADIEIKSFDIDKLHPSVIAQLDLDPTKVKSDQESLDKQNQEWAAQRQQQNQQFLAAEAAALAKTQAAAQSAASSDTNSGAAAAPKHKGKNGKGAPQTPPPAN